MNKCYLYLDGFTLGLALMIIVILLICMVFWARDYVRQIRRADRLQVKYNICRADLSAAEMELQGMKLRQAGIISDSKPPMQKTPSVNEGTVSKTECPYKVEPGSGE